MELPQPVKDLFSSQFMKDLNSNKSRILLFIICWALGAYILFRIIKLQDVTDASAFSATSLGLLLISIFLFLAPFASKLKLGSMIEFEREIKAVKGSVDDFKREMRNNIQMLNTQLLTVSSNQNVNVIVPSLDELRKSQEEMEKAIKTVHIAKSEESEFVQVKDTREALERFAAKVLSQENDDPFKALVRTYNIVHGVLISYLEKDDEGKISYDIEDLFQRFIEKFPRYEWINEHFIDWLKTVNAVKSRNYLLMPSTEKVLVAITIGITFYVFIYTNLSKP